ncbi:MAG: hypothetical protein AB8B91_06560 [Rubripirellula sp.]
MSSVSFPKSCLALVTVALLTLFCWSSSTLADDPPAQEEAEETSEAAEGTADAERATLPVEAAKARAKRKLPPVLPDGRPLFPVMLYQSQLGDLIPNTFMPVSIDRLSEAIKRLSSRATDDQASRLKAAVYFVEIVDGMLVSEQSTIDIESNIDSQVRRSLGKVNLAIEPRNRNSVSTLNELPRLESEPDGNLFAVFEGGSDVAKQIEFRWSLRGELTATGREFLLKLPPTPQTRIVIAAPRRMQIAAAQGVLRRRSAPPPDAPAKNRELRWYEIDAGGLDSVRIQTRSASTDLDSSSAPDPFVVRLSSTQYRAEPSGLQWTSRMVVQVPASGQFPELEVSGTTLTSIRVNGNAVPFTSKSTGGRVSLVQLSNTALYNDIESSTVNVSVGGHSSWASRSGWCDLPMPVWRGERVVYASPTDDVQLTVRDLEVMAWELPVDWRQFAEQRGDDQLTLTARGPSVAVPHPLTVDSTEDREPTRRGKSGGAWSRVRFANPSMATAADTMLKIETQAGAFNAKSLIKLTVDPTRIEPLRMRIERGWSLQTITFLRSGRVIENPNVNASTQNIVLWPEAEDVDGTEIVIEVVGTKERPSGLSIAPMWFARVQSLRGNMIVAILRPSNLNWSGEAALQSDRIKSDELSESEIEYFGSLGPEALYFRPQAGRTPVLSLQSPNVSFSTSADLQLLREGDDVTETLSVEVESPSQSLSQLVVQTGPANGRPPFLWSISTGDAIGPKADAPTISLPSSDVSVGEGEDEGIYRIDLSSQNLRGTKLIARRRYPVMKRFEIRLPTVPGAASQDSEVHVGPGLVVKNKSRSVQSVSAAPSEKPAGTRLRYDAVVGASIVIEQSDSNPDVTMVWHELVRVIASSRGADQIEAEFHVSPAGPITIEYEPGLKLTSVTRDNVPVDLIGIEPGPFVVLQPKADTETIRVVWNRSQYNTGWMRRCRIPRLRISGTVLKSEYRLESATDAFAPAALLRSNEELNSVEMRPNDNATLIKRNIALAIGWLFAMSVFAISWRAAEYAPLVTLGAVILLITVLVLWWPWKLAVIGWLLVPIVSAAMLATSRAWAERGNGSDSDWSEGAKHTPPTLDDLSADFSLESVARLMIWILIITVGWMCMDAKAQETSKPVKSSIEQAASVLVPVDADGGIAGETVYVPLTVHKQLFRTSEVRAPHDARFQSANYRVKIDPAARGQSQVSIEAEYLIHIEDGDRSVNQVLLPLSANAVRLIELLGDVNRIVPKQVKGPDGVLADLPRGNAFRLRVTLSPSPVKTEAWTAFTLAIPPVGSTHLTVETEQSMDAIRVGDQETGRLLEETDLRRWQTNLGPVDRLSVSFRTLVDADAAMSEPLKRRYWVNASKRQVTIDCEVDPPFEITKGETFQFVVRDDEMPALISNKWKLERSELYSPTRRLITMRSMIDEPGPIQLLWTRSLSQSDVIEGGRVQIPEVIAAALGENAAPWIALSSDVDLEFAPLINANAEPLSVDHFLPAWVGYRGLIDRAHVALDQIPTLFLRTKSLDPLTLSTEAHHLHVMPDQLELRYSASFLPKDHDIQRLTLRMPRNVELIRLMANGQPLTGQPIRSNGQFNDVLLGSFDDLDAVTVEAIGVLAVPSNQQFTLPVFQIAPLGPGPGSYTLSRDRSAKVRVKRPPTQADLERPLVVSDSLLQGRIPMAQWDFERTARRDESLDAVYEVTSPAGASQPAKFDCRQLIALARQDQQWTMETLIKFRSGKIPDFVDVEVPTRWCDSLEVSPAVATSRQPATDPIFQILRIHCDSQLMRQQVLSIQGKLNQEETGRINVPAIRVLGPGSRQVHISVPNQMEDAPIQWRTTTRITNPEAARRIWSDTPYLEDRSIYLATSPSWSVDLAPLRELESDAFCIESDSQIFAQSDGVLVACHWDILPGSLDSIDVRLPTGAECLGAWSAGRAVLPEVVEQSNASNATDQPDVENIVRIPLSLSRLAQPIEVLVRVPAAAAKRAKYLPELIRVSIASHWLTKYVPAESSSEGVQDPNRFLSLARSIVEAVEADAKVPERPRDEVVAWLRLWIARYQLVASSASHVVDFTTQRVVFADNATDLAQKPAHLVWQDFDARLGRLARRYFSAEEIAAGIEAPNVFQFGVANFEGYAVDQVTKLTAGNRPRAIQPMSSNDLGLRNLIVNLLTVVLVSGILMCLRPFYRYAKPIAAHPAFWVGLMGVFGLVVAPVPVAAALILVAVSLPVFPKRPSDGRASS